MKRLLFTFIVSVMGLCPLLAQDDLQITSLQYWWDDLYQGAVIMPYSGDEFILTANAFPVGLHSLKYRVKDSAGRWSALHSHYFYKGEVSEPARIVSYSYWWNDLSDKVTTHKLEQPTDVFELDENFIIPQEARTSYAGHYTSLLPTTVA